MLLVAGPMLLGIEYGPSPCHDQFWYLLRRRAGRYWHDIVRLDHQEDYVERLPGRRSQGRKFGSNGWLTESQVVEGSE